MHKTEDVGNSTIKIVVDSAADSVHSYYLPVQII